MTVVGSKQTLSTGAEYEMVLRRSIIDGAVIATIPRVLSFSYTEVLNNLGAFSIALPGDFDTSLLAKDRVIDISRKPPDGQLARVFRGLVTRIVLADDINNNPNNSIHGQHINKVLEWRTVAYAAGTSQAKKNAAADDAIKEVVNENHSSGAPSGRALPAANFTEAADTSDAQTIDKSFARKNVLRVCREFADASREKGTELYFGLVPDGDASLVFTTRTGQWGIDRTVTLGERPLLFSKNRANLIEATLNQNYTNEANGIYAGGQGEGAGREIVFIGNTDANTAELRKEKFADARSEETVAGVQTKAESVLTESRPILNFTGNLLSVPGSLYQVDWNIGDRVTADHAGLQFDCLIRSISVGVDGDGRETVSARAEASL